MSRMKAIIETAFNGLREALGVKVARAEEADRGHVKGLDFEKDLYEFVAGFGRQFADQTEFVRGTPGTNKCKKGDHLITLGDTTAAPGVRIVVEAKDQKYTVKKAIAELEEAKRNREAAAGIFVFAKGCEPPEFGNFKRIDCNFYCTVDKAEMTEGGPLLYLWAAYELARVQIVAAMRKDGTDKLDLERIEQQIEGIVAWVPRLGEIATKAKTVQNNGETIGTLAIQIKDDIGKRTAGILALLRHDAA